MITARIQIENGQIIDTYNGWGFIPIGSSKRFAAPEKKRDKSSYPEEAGAHEDARTVDDEFDYKITFLLETPNRNLVNANSKIKAWNDAVREKTAGSDIKRCRTITLYDDRMRCKIVGIPEIVDDVDDDNFHRWQRGNMPDCVKFDLTIHVNDPGLCDFDMQLDEANDRVGITLSAVGTDIKVNLSRALNENEHIVLLRKGSAKKKNPRHKVKDSFPHRVKRRHKWQVYYKYSNQTDCYYWPFSINGNGLLRHFVYGEDTAAKLWGFVGATNAGYGVRKSQASRMYVNLKNPMVTYGVAVYRHTNGNNEDFQRVSEVRYFTSRYDEARDATMVAAK